MMAKLKPCPFCGGKAYVDVDEGVFAPGVKFYRVRCKNFCVQQMEHFPKKSIAIDGWNTRAKESDNE